jgi:aminopeptidase
VQVGLNLQPGQRLLVGGPAISGGVSMEAAPLVREVAASAYLAGAPLVEVLWGDDEMVRARFRHAPRDSFESCSAWGVEAACAHADAGHALIQVRTVNPGLLSNEPPDLAGRLQRALGRSTRPFNERIMRNQTNWCVVAAPTAAWAARMFPGAPPEDRLGRLWRVIERTCRLDQPDPIEWWRRHVADLAARCAALDERRYVELRYRAPSTDLTVGLVDGHRWRSGGSVSAAGVPFTGNLPTEEIFTLPHRERVNGTIRGQRPATYGGMLLDGVTLTFSGGRITEARAEHGESVLRQVLSSDDGATRLGEVALVPQSSPVAQAGLVFYDALFDENAGSHIAVGAGHKSALAGGEALSDEAFHRAGGNTSSVHIDLTVGSDELDVDGVRRDGSVEPLLRRGEWAFAGR